MKEKARPHEVVAGAGAGEVDVGGLQAGLFEDAVQDRHQHLHLGELVGGAPVVGLREGDDGDLTHHSSTLHHSSSL